MSRFVDVTIWGWYELGIFWGSVGHVMVTEAGTEQVLLSQFPHSFRQPTAPKGPNTTLSFSDTNQELKRDPSVIFRVDILNTAAFDAMVANHRQRPVWDWDPTPPMQTHCARSSYDALRAGGVPIDPGSEYNITDGDTNQIIPNSLWDLLEKVPDVQLVTKNEDNLPTEERLAYEADISRYVPFSAWHKANLR
jgi:hypothetical protein